MITLVSQAYVAFGCLELDLVSALEPYFMINQEEPLVVLLLLERNLDKTLFEHISYDRLHTPKHINLAWFLKLLDLPFD